MSVDDESFHPQGQAWEDELEQMLDETEYDTALGLEMAEDAMAVTKGDLSEAEFHDRYHDAVMDEFGQDDRPTAAALEQLEEAGGSVSNALDAFDGDGEMDRREVMKKMGAGAAFLGLGAWATVDDGPDALNVAQDDDGTAADERDTQWGMVLDLEQCDGCLSCVTACAEENNLDSGVNWMYIFDWEDPDDAMNSGRGRLIRPCQHCTDAPCEKVCPTTARHTRTNDGLVLTDYDVCIGCRYCQVACPYGVNYFQWDEPGVAAEDIAAHHEEMGMGDHIHDERGRPVDSRAPRGVMSKCTMCPTRQDGHMGEGMVGTTACMEACPPEAIQFGNMNDEGSDPQQYREHPGMGRTLRFVAGDIDVDGDVEEVDEDRFEAMQAIALLVDFEWDDTPFDPDDEDALDEYSWSRRFEVRQSALIGMLQNNGLDRDDVLDNLNLDEDDDNVEAEARRIVDRYAEDQTGRPTPSSTFKLLEEYGTNPNVLYMGDEPGPRAEQVEPPISYDIGYERADGSEVELADRRKDVTDEGTVGGGLF